MKLTRTTKTYNIDVKRLQLPYIIEGSCKECGEPFKIDLENDILYYPKLNEPTEVYYYCEKCVENYEVKIIIDITVKIAE